MIDKLSKEEIVKHLDGDILPENVHIFDNIDSTNSYCKKLAEGGCVAPTLIVADMQTQGRGRLGRNFFSPAGTGIYMSILQSTKELSIPYNLLTVAAGTATCVELATLCSKDVKIKWVNDIFADGKKVCGILAEGITAPGDVLPTSVVVGIGINVSTLNFPDDIKDIAGSVNATGITRNEIISRVIKRFIKICNKYSTEKLINEYKNHSLVLGKKINFVQNNKAYTAVAKDINFDGNLVVETDDGDIVTLKSGEVSLGSENFI